MGLMYLQIYLAVFAFRCIQVFKMLCLGWMFSGREHTGLKEQSETENKQECDALPLETLAGLVKLSNGQGNAYFLLQNCLWGEVMTKRIGLVRLLTDLT